MRYLLILFLALTPLSRAITVREMTRMEGDSENVLRGVGIVVGLPGTGDSGKYAPMSRPLAAMLEKNGNPIGSLKDLEATKAVALVSVTCTLPPGGAMTDDTVDVQVAVLGNASTLKGGRLYLTVLMSPSPQDTRVYAYAEGPITIHDSTLPTTARVRRGGRLIRSVLPEPPGDIFNLVIDHTFAGWESASQIAAAMNQDNLLEDDSGDIIARAVDPRTVEITIPKAERASKAAFIGSILSVDVNPASLKLPALVYCNEASGAIVVTADVEISAVAIRHKDLTITTTVPPPVPSAAAPLLQTDRWAGVQTGAARGATARLSDLLSAFKQLDIPVSDQIEILQMLHEGGQLHARFELRDR